MFDRPSSMLTGKDVVSHSSSVVLTNILFFLLFWSLEIYAFPLCYPHLRGDNDFGSRVAGESCGCPWLAMGAEWAWEVQLKVSRRCNRGNAATFHAIGSQSSPCGFGLEEEGLSWRSAYEDQAAKTAWKRKNSSCQCSCLLVWWFVAGYQPKCFSKRRWSVSQGLDALLMAGWLCWSSWCSSCGLWCCPALPEWPSWLHSQCCGYQNADYVHARMPSLKHCSMHAPSLVISWLCASLSMPYLVRTGLAARHRHSRGRTFRQVPAGHRSKCACTHTHTHIVTHTLGSGLVLAAITCLGRPHMSWEFVLILAEPR